MRKLRCAAVAFLAVGMGLLAVPSTAGADDRLPPLVTTLQTVLDGLGDVLNTVTSTVLDDPGADITQASVEYAPGWIRMRVQLKKPIDPVRDARWSDGNYVEWSFDTNEDRTVDYTVEFATEDGELYGAVFDVSKPDDASFCDADSAGFTPQDGYTLVIDPQCIGKPRSLGYAVAVFVDTNPEDEAAPVVADRVPDRGLRPVAAPVQPGEVLPASPIAPTAAPGAPSAAPGAGAPVAPAPGHATPPGSAGSRVGAGSTPANASPAPNRAAAGGPPAGATGAVSTPAAAVSGGGAIPSGSRAAGVTVEESGPASLPRTGSASERNALLGLGLVLLGAGMLVMTRPNRPGQRLAGLR